MKKFMALVLALIMVVSLAACSGGSKKEETTTTTTTPAETTTEASAAATDSTATTTTSGTKDAYPNCNADGSINLDKIAHYDENYDYTQNPKYKVAYLAEDSGPLYQQSADAYEHWAPLFNMEWAGFVSSSGDSDMYMTNLQNMIDQGVKGFILDPDSTMFPAVVDVINQYPDVQWMSQMSAPRDNATGDGVAPGGNMIHPYVGFDNYDAGVQCTKKLIEWKKANLADVDWKDIGFISFDYSASSQLHLRCQGAQDTWQDETGSLDNCFVADCVSAGINLQAGIDTVGPIISTHSEYKHWLVMGLIDDFSQAAATVIDQQGLTDGSCVTDFGGSGLQMQWDQGQQDSYRYALFTAQNLYAEPIIGAVYAFLNGWATPETIWPSWINYNDCGGDGHTYPSLRLPTVWLEPDTYKHYLEWTDMYAHADYYNYSEDGIKMDDFSPFVDKVPAEYAKQS